MESRAKFLGHPIHPMLIVLPLGLLATGTVFDVAYVITDNEDLAVFSFWAIASGIVGGLLAAPFGFWDWLAIPRGTRAKRVGAWHGVGNVVIVAIFAVGWLLRLDDPTFLPEFLPMVLSLVGLGLALVTAWLGGELVYRLNVAVDDGAQLDASSSFGGVPAGVDQPRT